MSTVNIIIHSQFDEYHSHCEAYRTEDHYNKTDLDKGSHIHFLTPMFPYSFERCGMNQVFVRTFKTVQIKTVSGDL